MAEKSGLQQVSTGNWLSQLARKTVCSNCQGEEAEELKSQECGPEALALQYLLFYIISIIAGCSWL